MLFQETIANWEDWGRVYQSIPAFTPLALEICRREGLAFAPLSPLTPGTNAVFRVGGAVVKIFFPAESGLDPEPDFQAETAVSRWLGERGVPTPRVLAAGLLADRYDFRYLVTEFAEGQEAGAYLAAASPWEKRAFAGKLRALLDRLNQPARGLLPAVDLRRRAVENPRLGKLPPSLAEDLRRRASGLALVPQVLVHGDLTGENLLIQAGGELVILDCADACLAPAWYELGPIVFELFHADPAPLRALAGEESPAAFVERTLDSVCLHDFGADLLRTTWEREGLPPFQSLTAAREFLRCRLGGEGSKMM